VSFLATRLLHVSPVVVYLLVGLLVFSECALFVGFVLPGETAVLIGGFIASQGKVNVVVLCVVVVVASIVGPTVGYGVGARYGNQLLNARVLRTRRRGIDRALAGLDRKGASFVVLGRFTAFFRAVIPGLAGLSAMRFQRFVVANVAGGIVWGVGYTLLGYYAGTGYRRIARDSSYAAYGVGAVIVVLALVTIVRHRRRDRRDRDGTASVIDVATGTDD
jgi:membrane-associated protein